MLEEPSLRPVTYGCKDFQVPLITNDLNREETEEWQYLICESNFIRDLLGLIDILKPVVDLMLCIQSIHCPV